MKINEVEQIVDITKKNIRFYEQQGLLKPSRNETNRYRDYSEQDIESLKKIKLLRKLAVPISEIRRMEEAHLPLEDCLKRHLITLEREEKNLEKMRELCHDMVEHEENYITIEADVYLKKMEQLEQGGVSFVDAKKADKVMRKKKSFIAGIVMIVLMVILIGIFAWCTWGIPEDPMPVPLFLIMGGIPLAIIIGVVLSLRERMKEIEGGELYEASKY